MSIGQGHNYFPNKTENDRQPEETDRREFLKTWVGGPAVAAAIVSTYLGVTSSSGQNFITGLKGGEGVQPGGAAKSPQEQPAPPLPNSESEYQSDIAIYENIDPLSLPVSDKLFVGRDYLRLDEINDVLVNGNEKDITETFYTHIDEVLTNGRFDPEKASLLFLHNLENGLEAFKSRDNLVKFPDKASFMAEGTANDRAIADGIMGATPGSRRSELILRQFSEAHAASLSRYYDNAMREGGNLNESLWIRDVNSREIQGTSFNKNGRFARDISFKLTNEIEGLENPPLDPYNQSGKIPLFINITGHPSVVGFGMMDGRNYGVTPLEALADDTGYHIGY